jgi:ribonuclease/clavin/mitogillin
MATKILQAAAILLLKNPENPEVLLGRRAPSMLFLGNYWAFLGGSQTEADLNLQKALNLSAEETKRYVAIRELFEETGILLGNTHEDPMPLRKSPEAFAEAILQKRLTIWPDQLLPAGRYLTPDHAPLRFDTQYFIAWCPPNLREEDLSLSSEVSELCFIKPQEALSRWRASQMVIPSPVRVALSILSLTEKPSKNPENFANLAAQRAEKSRALDPVDCGDLGGRFIEVFPGVSLVPLRTPTLPPATHTNCALFGTKELLAVDPASPYQDEQKVLDTVLDHLAQTRGCTLKAILLTHHHQDHMSGAAYLKKKQNVPVYAHAKTAALVPAGLVDYLIEDGHAFELPGNPARRVTAMFTPGHAPGHLCYREETTGITASGDMVASVGTIIIDPSEGDMSLYLASLTRLKESKPSFLIPSHGLTIGDPAAKIDEYIKHRLAREAKVLQALQAKPNAKPQDLLETAYDDTPVALYPLAVRSLMAHLQKLVNDGVVTTQADGRFLANP